MFKLNYNKQGKLVTELQEVQTRIQKVRRERSECREFPYCSVGNRKSSYGHDDTINILSDAVARLWLNKISEDEFASLLKDVYKFENAFDYFGKLGKYFINLSGDLAEINRLNKELAELEEKEKELKEELGIK